MGGGPPCFPPGFSCPVVLWYRLRDLLLQVRDSYPLRCGFPTVFFWIPSIASAGPQPRPSEDSRFGLFPVRSPLLRKSFVIFFSSGSLDVSVHRVPSVYLFIQYTVTVRYHRRVSPFGYLWVKAYLQLTTAFRSLSRPSSALDAKAFTLRSY